MKKILENIALLDLLDYCKQNNYDTYVQSELVANTRQYKKILLKDNKLIKKI